VSAAPTVRAASSRTAGAAAEEPAPPAAARPPSASVTPPPSPQEAAAIAVALDRFVRDTTPPARPRAQTAGGWLRAARREAVARAPGSPPDSADWRSWRERQGAESR
jgi:hypothetical protein